MRMGGKWRTPSLPRTAHASISRGFEGAAAEGSVHAGSVLMEDLLDLLARGTELFHDEQHAPRNSSRMI
jgi:hypothetical protein